MGVHGTFCQLCGLPVQHDHYVPTASGMLKIYRGSSADGGHRWDPGERPFAFGPEHEWLKDAVVLPWDDARVLRGPIEDGVFHDDGEPIFVFDGGDDGLALHHRCWELQGSPASTEAAVRGNQTYGWALVESYHEQLFDFEGLESDGKRWMLSDPSRDARSRVRIEEILEKGRPEIPEAPTAVDVLVGLDRDWSSTAMRNESGERILLVRARLYTVEKADKRGYDALLTVSREFEGAGLPKAGAMAELEEFEARLKSAVERERQAVLTVARIGDGRAEWLVYARDGERIRSTISSLGGGASVELTPDPGWSQAARVLRIRE